MNMNNKVCIDSKIFNILLKNILENCNIENYENENKNSIKILNLILYSENEYYEKMKNILIPYLKYIKNILNFNFYFYCYNPNIKSKFEIKENILYIKGKETYIPGILQKTIDAFEILNNIEEYDYIVRTNISSIVDFKLLYNYLETNKYEYSGSKIWRSNKIKYISGTCIILNKDVVNKIIKNKNKIINYNLIDDMSIGKFLSQELKLPMHDFGIIVNSSTLRNKLILYRNKSEERNRDLINMKKIIKK